MDDFVRASEKYNFKCTLPTKDQIALILREGPS